MERKSDGARKPHNGKSNFKEYKRNGAAGSDKPARKRTALKNENDEPVRKSVTRSQKNSTGTGKTFEPRPSSEPRPERAPYQKKEGDRPYKSKPRPDGERPQRKNSSSTEWKKPFPKDGGATGGATEWKRPFAKDGGDKPFRKNADGPRDAGKGEWKKPFNKTDGDRPFKRNTDNRDAQGGEGDKGTWKKPFAKDGGDKPFKRKTAGPGESSEGKFSSRAGKRPFQRKTEDKPYDKPFKKDADAATNPFTRAPKVSKRNEDEDDGRTEREKIRAKEIETGLQSANRPSKPKHKEAGEATVMPLNKFVAHSGVCSRRDAATLVKDGKIMVNGVVITDPGHKIADSDEVVYDGKKLIPQVGMVYILLNKPKDYITTTDDPQGRKTVMELLMGQDADRLFPVGRLDRNTTGLLLITNDGNLTQKLSHPSYQIKKIYQVTLDKPLTKADFERIMEGLDLEDGKAYVDSMSYLETKSELGLEIHSGRNRIVRRIFESLGYVVEKLDRVMYAGLTKKNLPRGKWRYLNEREIILLKHFKS